MSLFDSYEADFQLAIADAKAKLSAASSEDNEQRKGTLQAIENATDECLELLDQMSLEVQNLAVVSRAAYNTKIRQYRSQVNDAKARLKQLLDEEDRLALFGGRYRDSGEHDDQRKQLLSSHASLERTNERLRDSQRVALETESIGGNILNDLRAQREQITNSRNTLSTADGYVDRSILTLKLMSRRLTANKFISYAIIAVLIILIFLVLASKFW